MNWYRIWSNKHQAWWRQNSMGYTRSRDDAGLFATDEAIEEVTRSIQHQSSYEIPNSAMVPVEAD